MLSKNCSRLLLRATPKCSCARFSSIRQFSLRVEESLEDQTAMKTTTTEEDNVPWYLRPEEASTIAEISKPLPDLPQSSPASLEGIVKLMHNKLGIENIKIFDKRDEDLEDQGMDISKNFIVIGTGKSDKHLQKATIELMNYIKHDLGNERLPKVEGFTRTSSILKKEKKLKRKLKKNTGYHFEDYGVPINSWIMVDCDHNIDNMSIHFVTEKRREELNLELLWCKPEDKHLYKRVRKPLINDDIFSGLRRYHSMSNKPVFNTFGDFLLGSKRYYSTNELLELTRLSDSGEYENCYKILKSNNYARNLKPYYLRSFMNHLDNLSIPEAQLLIRSNVEILNQLPSMSQHPTREEIDIRFQFMKTLHLILPDEFKFNTLEQILFTKLSCSYIDVCTEDLIEYLILVIESPEGTLNSKNKRIQDMLSSIELNDALLKDWETELLPYMLALVSNFNNSSFIKPRDVVTKLDDFEKFENLGKKPYNSLVDSIFQFLKMRNFPFLDNQLNLLIFISIYANAQNFDKIYEVLDEVHDISSLKPDNRPWDFVISYIYKTDNRVEYSRFINEVYPKISVFNNFSDRFNKYLKLMNDEIKLSKVANYI